MKRLKKLRLFKKVKKRRITPKVPHCVRCGEKVIHHHVLCDKCWLSGKKARKDL